MNSLSELRDLLVSKQIEILDFNGWQLRVGKDTWVIIHDTLYLSYSFVYPSPSPIPNPA